MTDKIETDRRAMSADPKAVVREFATICATTQMAHTLYRHLFERDQHRLRLYDEIAPLTFHDLSDIVGQHLLLQLAKLTDSAKTGAIFQSDFELHRRDAAVAG
jgi:hypothetical protein